MRRHLFKRNVTSQMIKISEFSLCHYGSLSCLFSHQPCCAAPPFENKMWWTTSYFSYPFKNSRYRVLSNSELYLISSLLSHHDATEENTGSEKMDLQWMVFCSRNSWENLSENLEENLETFYKQQVRSSRKQIINDLEWILKTRNHHSVEEEVNQAQERKLHCWA